ncbi:hypothetical protein F183_A07740 [Bryobacterales bacterium F-183]|nr:hypothetical protein F183_A07740 [Bryobacterales bacterium F-183]
MLTPDQWGRIERLFEFVEQAPAEDRERLVYESGEEDSIRWEVLKMLSVGDGAALLDVDLRARPARLAYKAGDTLSGGRFRIDALIAEGGMGQVYRATDLELNTPVALKTIHRAFAANTQAVEQFKQEVQLARSINHPNVCRIFDLERQDNELFLTMELLDGETLRALLDRQGRLSEADAWRIFEQVLSALAASHERGVLHRDLKPSNIYLANQPEQRVVVTDFGVAARTSTSGDTKDSTISAGTPAYMAPEQFRRDHPFTPSTDLYAAGIMLYEMVCGRGPFTATTPEQMDEQKSLNQAVPVRQWLPGVSRRWEKALQKAIQADPKLRFASAQEFAAALRPPITPKRVSWVAAAVAACCLIALVVLYPWREATGSNNGNATLTIQKLTRDGGYSMEPAITPDGSTVVFASDRGASGIRSLWKMATGREAEPVQLTYDTVDSSQPTISPDGKWVVYRSELDGGGLFALPIDENTEEVPRLLVRGGTRPRFSPDGRWIVYMTSPATATQLPQVYAVPFQATPTVELPQPVHVSHEFRDAHNPIWSEDGRYVLFCGTRVPGVPDQEHDWWLVPFVPRGATGTIRKTGMLPALNRLPQINPSNRLNEDLWVWKDGYVYYSSPQIDSTSIWRVPFTLDTPMPVQAPAPQRLTSGPSEDRQPSIGGNKIVFASGATNIDVWMLPLHANQGVAADEPVRVTETTDFEVSPSIEPASRSAVFTKVLGGRRELRLMDIRDASGGGEIRSISPAEEVADHPLWSRDGKWIAYRKFEAPYQRLAVMDRAGGSRRVLCEDCGHPSDWSPDQQYLLFEPGSTVATVERFEFATGRYLTWIAHPEQSLRGARYSPDGRWIAFHAEASPLERRVYIAPNRERPAPSEWIRVGFENFSGDGGGMLASVDFQPAWSPDGNLLYWLSGRDGFRCIWAQRLDPVTKKPQGPPFAVRHFHRSRRSLLRQVPTRATQVGFRVYRDRAYFSMDEVTGNVWIADLPR